jgi:tRNA A37 N6-isopentenylltransferase MiaA
MTDARAILIAGPTAGGKSGLALRLAERLGGVVINADSMQVYGELRILTARPSPEDEARAPHALYGFVAGAEGYSAGRYAGDAARALADARRQGLRPIFVGGTGLYFKTLIEGLSPIPAIDAGIREHWRGAASEKGALHLHAILSTRDPAMAERLAPGDTQRIVRALEVLEATGTSLLEWQRLPREPVLDLAQTIAIVVGAGRAELCPGPGGGGTTRRRGIGSLAADHGGPGPASAVAPCRRRKYARGGRRGCANGDAAIREKATHVGKKQHACVAMAFNARNRKLRCRFYHFY